MGTRIYWKPIAALVSSMALLILLLVLTDPAHAQITMIPGVPYTSLVAQAAADPCTSGPPNPCQAFRVQPTTGMFTWTVYPSGTVSTVTVNLEGSNDSTNGVNGHWFMLDQIKQTDVDSGSNPLWSSTNGEMRHVVNKGLIFVRCKLVTITGGGNISATIALFH